MTNKPYNLNTAPHLVTNQVIRRIEDYLYDANVKVKFGEEGHAIIQQLVDQYVDKLSEEDVLSAGLALTNQELKTRVESLERQRDAFKSVYQKLTTQLRAILKSQPVLNGTVENAEQAYWQLFVSVQDILSGNEFEAQGVTENGHDS